MKLKQLCYMFFTFCCISRMKEYHFLTLDTYFFLRDSSRILWIKDIISNQGRSREQII